MKSKSSRLLLQILFVLLMLTLLVPSSAALAAKTPSESARLYRGTYSFSGKEETFYYSDAFFLTPGEDDRHLMTLSAAAAFSLQGTSEEETVDLMTDIGMDADSIEVQDIVKGTPDTVGTVISHQSLGEKTLVSVVIRGDAYDGEWASNVLVGAEGDAAGFSAAASVVSDRLLNYLADYAISDAIIWVSGYSRGGGIANLIGRFLNEAPADYHTAPEDIYVYTFEAPRSSADDTVYSNIRNVMDVNDVVPHLYPEAWGLHLNGVPYWIGSKDETVMGKSFYLMDDEHIQDFEEQPKAEFLTQFESFLAKGISRASYAADDQDTISKLCAIYFSKDDNDRQKLGEYFTKAINNLQQRSDFSSLIFGIWWSAYTESNVEDLSKAMSEELAIARDTEDPPLTDEEYDALQSSVRPLAAFILKLADVDQYKAVTADGKKKTLAFYHLLTFFSNLTDLMRAHYSTTVWSQLCAEDPYYFSGVRIKPGDLYIGQRCYTYADYGSPLEDMARDCGFTESDLTIWRNGYDLRIDNEMTLIAEPDLDLVLKASGTLDKSMKMYSYYTVKMEKRVGFRSYPADGVKFPKNEISIILPREIGDKSSRFAVVQVDESGTSKLYHRTITTENGDVKLSFNAAVPAIYASAYDDYGHYTLADVDRDGQVSVMDVTHIQRYLADMEYFGAYQLMVSDIDGDGEATIIDATWIRRRLALMSTPYEIGGLLS